MADELHLALLGHLEIRRRGAAVTGFTSNKVRALLSYLVVTLLEMNPVTGFPERRISRLPSSLSSSSSTIRSPQGFWSNR